MTLKVYSWFYWASRFQIQDSIMYYHSVIQNSQQHCESGRMNVQNKNAEKKEQMTISFLNNNLMFVSCLFSVFFFHCFVCHADEAISYKGHRKNWKQCRSNTHESFTYFRHEMGSYNASARIHSQLLLQLHTESRHIRSFENVYSIAEFLCNETYI